MKYIKKGFAYFLIFAGVWVLFMGECLVDSEWILHHHYFIERFVIASALCGFGYFYLELIDARLQKTNGRRC